MSRRSVFTARLRALFFRKRLERELDEEVRFHLDMQAEDNLRAGMDPAEAGHAALRSFGGLDTMKERYRERRALHFVDTMAQDVRYALRAMRKNPGFTFVAVLSLAIGIGANTAVFSFADALLLRPLTVPRPGGLLRVGLTDTFSNSLVASYRDYIDIRDRSRSFDGLMAYTRSTVGMSSGPGHEPNLSIGMLVSGNFFHVIGVEPQLGRDFRPEEDQVPGRDAVVILGHDFWEQRFGADPSILGRTIWLNGIEFTVVGVAPQGFTGLDQFARLQFYAPLMIWPRLIDDPDVRPFEARHFRSLLVGGRLRPGVTMPQAQAELAVIAADLERTYPDTNRNQRIIVRTELQNRIAQAPPVAVLVAMLTMLAGAVLFVACANVAGLLTSRAPMRAREIALRLALGAGRPRVVRQLITESLLIAAVGAIAGLGVGYTGVKLFRLIQIPTELPVVASFALDRRALLVSLVIALASAVLFGLAPAIRSTRADLTAVMKATDTAGHGRRRWGHAVLVSGQVAVSVVLLVIATFMYRGFQQMLGSGPGFRTGQLLSVSLPYRRAQPEHFLEQAAEQARLTPGVESAALTRYVPMDGIPPSTTIVPEGFQFPTGKESAAHASSMVDEHYFDTIELPILKGRGFLATDSGDAPKVAVVNEVLAGRYWPGQDPVGKRFRLGSSRGPWVEVVGVARVSKYSLLIERPMEFVYLPYRQHPPQSMQLLVKSLGDPSSLAMPLRTIVTKLDANMPMSGVRTMEEIYRMRTIVFTVVIALIAAMGTMGLGLSIAGLYGLVAYAVSRRTKEIGIRMAIGASRSDVVRMVLRQGMVLAAAGLAIGVMASAGAQRAMAAAFPGGPSGGRIDFVALALVGAAVLAVTLVAAYVPARRASRINPTEALRYD